MSLVTFRHFCTSPELLGFYRPDGDIWTSRRGDPEKLRTAVTLSLRNESPSIPDHQHRQRVELAFGEARSLGDMLLRALGVGGTQDRVHGLSLRQGRIYVDAPAFEDWQHEVCAWQSPVPLLAAFRLNEGLRQGQLGSDIAGQGARITPVEQQLKEDLRSTCLPGMHDPCLDELLQQECEHNGRQTARGGRLVDAHIHINGSTEATVVWLHALANSALFCGEVGKAARKYAKMRFFLHQLHTTEQEIFKDLRCAAHLRQITCLLLRRYQQKSIPEESCPDEKTDALSWAAIAARLRHADGNVLLNSHPLQRHGWTDLQSEGLFWLRALTMLWRTASPKLAVLLHFYLLLMHQFFRLLVQHPDQYGFDQFQYITLDGGREAAENSQPSSYSQRFSQFCGMYGTELALLEARFSPKDSVEKNCSMLRALWQGYQKAMQAEREAGHAAYDISLVAHFIKQAEKTQYTGRRYFELRDDSMRKARALVATQRRLSWENSELAQRLVGKDAASNELETPPEVFAPAFRYLKRHGITATTYHAGEDFTHVLCGMRAVYEASYFLDMGSGDRIGHATAIGIDPEICCGDAFTNIFCPRGVWLDSLIWLTWMLHQQPRLAELRPQIPSFIPDIEKRYREVYHNRCPELSVLWAAWKLRTLDPTILNKPDDTVAISDDTRSELCLRERLKDKMGKQLYPQAVEEFRRYHAKACRQAYDEPIPLSCNQQPSAGLLRAVQDAIVQDLRDRRIAIEVLPTSNVRISHYQWTKQHHLLHWLDPANERPVPFVLLGTDDPGIFATTMRNEIALVLRRLNRMYPDRSEKPYEIVNHLIRNGRSYSFPLAKNEHRDFNVHSKHKHTPLKCRCF